MCFEPAVFILLSGYPFYPATTLAITANIISTLNCPGGDFRQLPLTTAILSQAINVDYLLELTMTSVSHSFGFASSSGLLSWVLLCLNNPVMAESPVVNASSPEMPITNTEENIAQISPSNEEEDRSKRISYFGIGGTLGLSADGETELGNGGFSILSRTSITDVLSLHTASVIGGDGYSSFALTGSFPMGNRNSEESRRPAVIPFAGAGIGVRFENFDIDPMVTVGADIPITDRITGTARTNANFGEDGTDIGLVLGVGIRLFR